MLSDRFNIHYRHPAKTPIQLSICANRLMIDCRFHYNRRALRPDPKTGASPADTIEAGIIQRWSGIYRLPLPGQEEAVEVQVAISRTRDRRSVPIRVRRLLIMPAHVISPFYRRFWGFFKTGHLESIGTNWSLQQPGCMVLPLGLTSGQLQSIAAHEAGHLFGLGDAYAAIYRFYDAVPDTGHYMMHSNQAVQPEEILMLLQAHARGRMQFFPQHWKTGRFVRGLGRDLVQRARQLKNNLAVWRQI